MTEGICIPLVAKPDLIRNVTIRGCGVVGLMIMLALSCTLLLLLGTIH